MNIQYLIVAILLAVAVMYAVWRIYRALRAANDPCYGCEGCQLKEIRDAQRKKELGHSLFGNRQKAPCGEKK
ncbi:MAG: FeoB-associated Cys-rich membrane protein [Prevotella sp.]|nr:FeoB-associated Cys-rich membrane protein [Prevotella sp.]